MIIVAAAAFLILAVVLGVCSLKAAGMLVKLLAVVCLVVFAVLLVARFT